MMMDEGGGKMEIEIGQRWGGNWMEVEWEQHEDRW